MKAKQTQDKAYFWSDPLLGDLELLHANYVTHAFTRHAHEEFAIGVIYSGAQALTYRRADQILMPAGSIAAVNPGEMHTGYAADPDEGWTYRMLYPAPDLLQRVASEITGQDQDIPFFPHPVIFDNRLAHQIYHMHCALEDLQTPAIERETYLLSVLTQLIVRHADSRPIMSSIHPGDRIALHIRDYLRENYRRNVSLTELSNLTRLSTFQLCRVFKAVTGFPPHAYLNLIRVYQAKRLLRLRVPIVQVALDVGFCDQTHLTKRFKAVFGITPKQYAKGTARKT